LPQIEEAISIDAGMRNANKLEKVLDVEKLLGLCMPLLEFVGGSQRVRPIHGTLRQLLFFSTDRSHLEPSRSPSPSQIAENGICEDDAHAEVASACLAYLSILRPQLDLAAPITAEKIQRLYPFISYAVSFCCYHLVRGTLSPNYIEVVGQLQEFLKSSATESWFQGIMQLEGKNWGGRLLVLEADLRDIVATLPKEMTSTSGSLKKGLIGYQLSHVKRVESRFGRHHQQTISVLNSVGRTLVWVGKFKEARDLFVDLLRRKEFSGDTSSTRLATLHELGAILAVGAEYDEARAYLEEALEGRKALLGADAVPTLKTSEVLAGVAHSQGDV